MVSRTPKTRKTQRTARTLTRPQANSLMVTALFAVHSAHAQSTRLLPSKLSGGVYQKQGDTK